MLRLETETGWWLVTLIPAGAQTSLSGPFQPSFGLSGCKPQPVHKYF
jgi:hypothetical protein